jgi:xanthine dehydrogenase accessory factor
LDYIRKEGFSEQDIERVMAPSGLDLGPKIPEEIALCVISELVMVRRQGTGIRMRDKLEMESQELAAAG